MHDAMVTPEGITMVPCSTKQVGCSAPRKGSIFYIQAPDEPNRATSEIGKDESGRGGGACSRRSSSMNIAIWEGLSSFFFEESDGALFFRGCGTFSAELACWRSKQQVSDVQACRLKKHCALLQDGG